MAVGTLVLLIAGLFFYYRCITPEKKRAVKQEAAQEIQSITVASTLLDQNPIYAAHPVHVLPFGWSQRVDEDGMFVSAIIILLQAMFTFIMKQRILANGKFLLNILVKNRFYKLFIDFCTEKIALNNKTSYDN